MFRRRRKPSATPSAGELYQQVQGLVVVNKDTLTFVIDALKARIVQLEDALREAGAPIPDPPSAR